MTLGRCSDSWYLLNNTTKQYCKISSFMGRSLNDDDKFTYWIGPYAFVNEFEETTEAQYLIKMLEYPRLNTQAQRKVDNILNTYKYWVQTDKQMIEILERRDKHNIKEK